MVEDNYHPNVTQQKPASWRTGVYTASQPVVNDMPQGTEISKVSRPSFPMTQPSNFQNTDTSSEVKSKTIPSAGHTNAAKIIPRLKPSFKPRPVISQSQPQKQTTGPRTVPSFKPITARQPSQVKATVQKSNNSQQNATNGLHCQVSTSTLPQPEKRPNFQIQDDPDVFELNPVKQIVRPTFNASVKSSATTPKFAPKLVRPVAPVVKSKPQIKRMPSTPKQIKVKTPSTPKLNPNNSLSDSGLGSSLSCSPFPSSTSTQLFNTSHDIIPSTPSTPVTKRPTDMVKFLLRISQHFIIFQFSYRGFHIFGLTNFPDFSSIFFTFSSIFSVF